ncbi:uncharacterized protein LOC144365983 isoform X2 [Ictidomys tridecemlineatus]
MAAHKKFHLAMLPRDQMPVGQRFLRWELCSLISTRVVLSAECQTSPCNIKKCTGWARGRSRWADSCPQDTDFQAGTLSEEVTQEPGDDRSTALLSSNSTPYTGSTTKES